MHFSLSDHSSKKILYWYKERKKESEIAQSYPTLCSPMDYQVRLVTGIFWARILEWVAFPSLGDLCDPGIEPRSPALWADALPSEPPGKSNWYREVYWYRDSFCLS